MRSPTPPDRGTAAVAAWVLAATAVGGLVASSIGALMRPVGEAGRLEALWILSWPGFPIVGALIVSRRAGNRVGWLLLGMGTGIAMGVVASGLAAAAFRPGSRGTALAAWIVFDAISFNVGFGLIPLLLLYFPDGEAVGRTGRWLARIVAILLALNTLAWILRDNAALPDGTEIPNPIAPPVIGAIAEAAPRWLVTGLVCLTLAAIATAVVRYRRSTGIARLQIRWFAAAAAALPLLGWLGAIVASLVADRVGTLIQYTTWVVGLNGLAVAIGIAVLRYRLYEIDRVVSRTVTYAVVTAVLIGVYALVAALPSAVFALESDLLVAGATLAAAAVFMPVRRRVQVLVDLRFNRARYDAQRVIDAFAWRIRRELQLDDLRRDLASVVGATVQPAHVTVWLAGRRPARATPERVA